VVDCQIEGVADEALLDTGAQITVFRRSNRKLPVARLRMKSATSHKASLYGPLWTDVKIGGKTYPFQVYEADIDENLLGYDFMDYYDADLKIKRRVLKLGKDEIPFRVQKSENKGKFDDGKIYYAVRANHRMVLRPFVEKEVSTYLEVDTEETVDELNVASMWVVPEVSETNAGRDSAGVLSTSLQSPEPQVFRTPRAANTGKRKVKVNESSQQKEGSEKGVTMSQPERIMRMQSSTAKLGLFVTNSLSENRVAGLPHSIIAQSGVVPCVSAPLKIKLQNVGDKCVEISKHTIIGEVYLVHPLRYSGFELEDDELMTDEDVPLCLDNEDDKEVVVCTCEVSPVEHDVQPHEGAEIKKPDKPPITTLPKDLQELMERSSKGKTAVEKAMLEEILKRHYDVFAPDNHTFGSCPWLKFRIDTGDHPPIKQNARPIPLHYRKEVKETFLKYLKMGAIKPSQSAWASPILCVPKKTGEVSVCVDYRALNEITRVPAAPIPRTSEILQHLAGSKLYHSVDLAHGYHNLMIHPDDQAKTAIILPEDLGLPSRQYEYTRMGFGLSAAPGAFQYVTDRLITPAQTPTLDNDLGSKVAVYIDDVCIAGDNFPQMLQRLNAFFNRVRAGGFLLKAKKCELFQEEISFLGHRISGKEIKVDLAKIEKITHWPSPINQKEVRSWLGLVQYYAKYVPHLATLATPIFYLTRKGVDFVWTTECEQAFQTIKEKLASPPILGTPNVDKGQFTVTCDASLTGLGAVLTQEQDGHEVTIAYWSKLLNQAQRNYCATHRELLALVEAVKTFNHYLAGAPFIVKSDHAALQWLKNFKNPTGKLARWLERLAPYKFQVVHERGVDIGHADALSRRPNRPCNSECKKCKKTGRERCGS